MASDPIGNGDGGVDGRESPTEREVPPSLPPPVPQPISIDSSLTEDRSRKRDVNTFENDGPKRCFCRHSKCLKLYCQCFLSGEYCAEGCGCRHCYNTAYHEDTVLGVREKIKSSNPSAFDRKIIIYETKLHLDRGEDRSRKRDFENEGPKSCLCRHSKCLKLYCQCFLNGKFCAEGCGCRDCYNTADHEDTVLAAREKKLSFNPSAFIERL